jgi:hypothetical protein
MAIPSPVGKAKVKGTSSAVPIVAVKPGKVPTIIPIMTPKVSHISVDSESA